MRIWALIVAVLAVVFLSAPASAQDAGSPPGKPAVRQIAGKIGELQKLRIVTLKALVDTETALYSIGKTSPEAVLEAKVLLHEAELAAAEKDSDRIGILQSLVDARTQQEETAKARKRNAEATEAPVLKAKAARLEAEIRLEQARESARAQAKNAEPRPEKIVVIRPQEKDVDVTQQFAGQLRSRRHIDVRSLQTGYLEAIEIQEGQAVKQGDVMFRVATVLYREKLDAQLAEVQIATLHLQDTERLFQNKVVSAKEVALSKAKLASAQAKAKLAQAELNLTVIRAPFDGIVGRLQEQQGSLASEGAILTTLSDNSQMWAYFQVPQATYLEYLADPEKAREVELVLANGRKFPQPGAIAAIESQFNEQTGNISFRADFPNPEGRLRHGMAGTVLIRRTLRDALVIPQRATFEMVGQRYVYVVDNEGVAHRREVEIQRELADAFVIQKGLAANDRIVLEGVRQIHAGDTLPSESLQP